MVTEVGERIVPFNGLALTIRRGRIAAVTITNARKWADWRDENHPGERIDDLLVFVRERVYIAELEQAGQ